MIDSPRQRAKLTVASWGLLMFFATTAAIVIVGGLLAQSSLLRPAIILALGMALLCLLSYKREGSWRYIRLLVLPTSIPLGVAISAFWFNSPANWSSVSLGNWSQILLVPLNAVAVPILMKRYGDAVREKNRGAGVPSEIMRPVWVAVISYAIASILATLAVVSVIQDSKRWDAPGYSLIVLGSIALALALLTPAYRSRYMGPFQPISDPTAATIDLGAVSAVLLIIAPLTIIVTLVFVLVATHPSFSWWAILLGILFGLSMVDSLIANTARLHLVRTTALTNGVVPVLGTSAGLLVVWLLGLGLWIRADTPVPLLTCVVVTSSVIIVNAGLAVVAGHVLSRARRGESVTESVTELNVVQDSLLFQAIVILAGVIPIIVIATHTNESNLSKLMVAVTYGLTVGVWMPSILRTNLKHAKHWKMTIPAALSARSVQTGEAIAELHSTWRQRLVIRIWYQNILALAMLLIGAAGILST